MNKFKPGDKVLRICGNYSDCDTGVIYTVEATTQDGVCLQGLPGYYKPEFFLNLSSLIPRPHLLERIAYAYGADIELLVAHSDWNTIAVPSFKPDCSYRIKPQEQEDPVLTEIKELKAKLEVLEKVYNDAT